MAISKLNKLTKMAREHVEPGEAVMASVVGARETTRFRANTVRNGVLIATGQRVMLYANRVAG